MFATSRPRWLSALVAHDFAAHSPHLYFWVALLAPLIYSPLIVEHLGLFYFLIQ